MLDLTTGEVVFAGTVLFVAAYVRGYSGFGFSAVLVAGMTFVIEPLAAVPLAIAFEVLASAVQAPSVWSEIRWRHFAVLLVAAAVGNPLGVWVLTTADPEVLRAATFGILLLMSLGLVVARPTATVPTTKILLVVGTVAGIVNGATALAGLVLVLAMTWMVIPAVEMRATLIAYFFASDLLVIGLLSVTDQLDATMLWRVVLGLPLLVLGIAIGSRTFGRASAESFRFATLGLLIAISLVGLVRLVAG